MTSKCGSNECNKTMPNKLLTFFLVIIREHKCGQIIREGPGKQREKISCEGGQ